MAVDASRITIAFPDMDYDGDGAVDASSGFTACVFAGPNWSGFNKPSIPTTCSSDTLNSWGNLVKTFQSGTIVDYGTISPIIDWDIANTEGGDLFGAFQSRVGGDFTIQIPASVGETTGPIITIPGIVEGFTPQGEVLGEGDEARFAAQVVIKITGDLSFTAAV